MMMSLPQADTRIDRYEVSAYKIPTDMSESDGTYTWDSTTLVVVRIGTRAGKGWGYTYADIPRAKMIEKTLCAVLKDHDAMAIPDCGMIMRRAIRNIGRPGMASMAIAAVDMALWDLKARVLNIPLIMLFGRAQDGIPIYGSGGFTSYTDQQLENQLGTWVKQGISQVKIKVGRHPDQDLHRVHVARNALQPGGFGKRRQKRIRRCRWIQLSRTNHTNDRPERSPYGRSASTSDETVLNKCLTLLFRKAGQRNPWRKFFS